MISLDTAQVFSDWAVQTAAGIAAGYVLIGVGERRFRSAFLPKLELDLIRRGNRTIEMTKQDGTDSYYGHSTMSVMNVGVKPVVGKTFFHIYVPYEVECEILERPGEKLGPVIVEDVGVPNGYAKHIRGSFEKPIFAGMRTELPMMIVVRSATSFDGKKKDLRLYLSTENGLWPNTVVPPGTVKSSAAHVQSCAYIELVTK